MRKASNILLLLFITIGLCGKQTTAKIGFYPQKEYRYEYSGQVLSGLPDVANEWAAVGIDASVTVQSEGSNLVVQLDNVQAFNGKYSGRISPKDRTPLPLQSQVQPEFRLPFRILYKGNTDEFLGIETSRDDPAWSFSVKKALASFLHVRLDQHVNKRQGYFADRSTTESYGTNEVVELSVDGKCNTRYIYNSFPPVFKPSARVLNVTKVHDSFQCQDRPVWKTSITEPLKCEGCDPAKESFTNHANVAHYNILEESGEYTLQNADAYSQAHIQPLPPKGDTLTINQYQRLSLKGVSRSSSAISIFPSGQGKRHVIVGLDPEDDVERIEKTPVGIRYRRQTKTGTYTKISPLKKQPITQDKKENIRRILEKINKDADENREINLIEVPKVVDILRQLTKEEIQELYNSAGDEEKQKQLINFIVMSGTDAAILFIKSLLEQNKLTGEFAANIVSNIAAYVLEPKPSILEEIWSLCKGRLIRQSRQLYVTTLLAFGELVNQACVPKGAPKTFAPFRISPTIGCPTSLTSRFLQEAVRVFDQSPDNWERVAVSMMLYRMGLNDTIEYIAPLLQPNKYFSYLPSVRAVLMISIYESGPGREQEVMNALMPIFYNYTLTASERIVALDAMSYITTSQKITNQLAQSTWSEPDPQVHSYLYSHLLNVANFTQSCFTAMALRARQALPLAKPIDSGIFDSRIEFYQNFAKQWGLGTSFGYGYTFSPKASIPTFLFGQVATQIGGYYYSALEYIVQTTGLQKAVDYLLGPQSYFPHDYSIGSLFKDDKDTQKKSKYHHDDIKINPRNYDPLNAFFGITYLGTRHRLFFLDSNTFDDIKKSGLIPPNKDLYSALRDGIPINIRKFALLEDTQLKVSSVIGVPLTIELRIPVYIDISGKISVEAAKTGITNSLSSLSIKPELQSKFAYKAWLGVRAEVPFTKTAVGAYATRSAYTSLSLHGYLNADLTQRSISAGLRQAPTKQTHKSQLPVFKIATDPAIYIHNKQIDEQIVYPIRRTGKNLRSSTVNVDVGLLGKPITLTYQSDMTIGEETEFKSVMKDQGLLHYLTFWWIPHSFTYHSLEVTQDPPSTADTDQVELKINWKITPTPFEEEMWRGKSVLQKIRFWTMIPEWTELPLQCDALEDTIPYRPSAPETTTKKSWFSRFKDKVKTTFGRSGGDDPESEEDDDDKDDDDRGRALHPHLVTSSSVGGDSSGSRYSDYSGQSRFAGNTGQDYGGQSQYGGGFEGQTHGNDDSEDFSQQSSKGHGSYAPGTGTGSGGQQTYPYRPQTADQTATPKKSLIKVINLKDEISTAMIAVQLNTLGHSKGQINTEITITKNQPQGTGKVSVSVDFNNIGQYLKNFKICYNVDVYNMNTKCMGRLNKDGANFETRIQWGATCDNTNFLNFKAYFSLGPDQLKKFEELKRKCNTQRTSYADTACLAAYKQIYFSREVADITFSKNVPTIFQGWITHFEKENCLYNKYLAAIIPGNFAEAGRVVMEKDYHEDEPLFDFEQKTEHYNKVLKNFPYLTVGAYAFPLTPYYSYPYNFFNRLAHGKLTERCTVQTRESSIDTFNSFRYNYSCDGCEYVVAKDCSPSQLFTITAASQPNKIEKMTLYLLDHKLTFNPTSFGSAVEFLVDDKKQSLTKGQTAVIRSQGYDDIFLGTVSAFGPKAYVKSPQMGLVVSVSSDTIVIVLSTSWKGKVCGLCGESTGQPKLSFIGPDQCRYFKDFNSFAQSYRLPTSKCSSRDAPYQSLCQQQSSGGFHQPFQGSRFPTGYGESSYPGGYGEYPGSAGRRTSEGQDPFIGQTFGGSVGSYDEHSEPFSQQSGSHQYGQISQTSDDHHGHIDARKNPFSDRITDTSTKGSPVDETVIKAVTRAPLGTGDEGGCVVRRNFLKRQVESVKGTRVKKLCFSTEPVRQCRRTCAGVNLAPQTVQFVCYREPHAQAEKWASEVNDRPITELTSKDFEFEEEIMVAQDCYPQY